MRTLAEAERSIRVSILKVQIREREEKLEAELRKRFVVKIDDAALAAVELPAAATASAATSAIAAPTAQP